MTVISMRSAVLGTLFLCASTLLSGCSNTPYRYTKLVDVQPNAEAQAQPTYQRPVIGVLVDDPIRGPLENDIVAALRAQGVDASAALPVFGDKGIEGKSRDYLAQRMRDNNFDSAVSIELVDKKIENLRTANGPSTSAPTPAAMSMRPAPLGPDFSINEVTYVSHVRFWDVPQQKVVWAAMSVTHNPRGIASAGPAYAKIIANQLIQAGLFDTTPSS